MDFFSVDEFKDHRCTVTSKSAIRTQFDEALLCELQVAGFLSVLPIGNFFFRFVIVKAVFKFIITKNLSEIFLFLPEMVAVNQMEEPNHLIYVLQSFTERHSLLVPPRSYTEARLKESRCGFHKKERVKELKNAKLSDTNMKKKNGLPAKLYRSANVSPPQKKKHLYKIQRCQQMPTALLLRSFPPLFF